MFDAIVNIDENVMGWLVFIGGLFLFLVWMSLSSIVQAGLFVRDEPLRYWSNPLKEPGGKYEGKYRGIFGAASPSCDNDDKAWDIICTLSASYFLMWGLLILNYIWLPAIIIAGVIGGLYGARAIVRLKKALGKHIADKNVHKGDE